MNAVADIGENTLAGLFEDPATAARAADRPWEHRTWWTVVAGRGRCEGA